MLAKLSFKQYSIVCVLFFFCVNHFSGFEQDCVLYTLQAISHMAPERFVGDPAFMFGNQDAFSLFSPLYCLFIEILPIDTAALVMGGGIHGLFAFFATVLIWKWTRIFHCRQLLLPVVLCFFALYSYGEARNELAFCTKIIESVPVPRTLSAALGFGGLAFLFEKKKFSLGLFVLGTLFHPLTAGWCLPIWVFFYFPKVRKIVIPLSVFFPLTVFIGVEPWARDSGEWLNISLGEGLGEQAVKMSLFFAFFWIASTKINLPGLLKKFLKCFTIVLGISFYWFVIALLCHHIFLYQVQTFRIQWICQILATFVSVWFLYRLCFIEVRPIWKVSSWEKIFLGVLVALWIDSAFFVILAMLVILCVKLKNTCLFKVVEWGTLLLCIGGVLFFCYDILGLSPCVKPEYVYAARLLYLRPFVAVLSAMILCLALFFPKYRLILSTQLIVILLFIMSAWRIFPRESFSVAYVLGTLIFVVLCLQWKKGMSRLIRVLLVSVIMSFCIFLFYDHRDEQQKLKEKAMNQFVQGPPFPSIVNRGRILYSVQSYGEEIPRLRFLSGGYYDFQIKTGSIFFKQQRLETDRRERKIFSEDGTLDSVWRNLGDGERFQKSWAIISNRDSLSNRFGYLCGQGEITHLVTDAKMPFSAQDSLILWYNNERIWLYGCD